MTTGFRTERPFDDTHQFAPAPQAPVQMARVQQAHTENLPQHIMEPVAYRSGIRGGLPTPAQAGASRQAQASGGNGLPPMATAPQQQSMGYRTEAPMNLLDEIGSGIESFLRSIFGGDDAQSQGVQGQSAQGNAINPWQPMTAATAPTLASPMAKVNHQAPPPIDQALGGIGASSAATQSAAPAGVDAPIAAQASAPSPLAGVFNVGTIDPFTSNTPMGAQQAFMPDDGAMMQPKAGSFENSPVFSGEGFSASR